MMSMALRHLAIANQGIHPLSEILPLARLPRATQQLFAIVVKGLADLFEKQCRIHRAVGEIEQPPAAMDAPAACLSQVQYTGTYRVIPSHRCAAGKPHMIK